MQRAGGRRLKMVAGGETAATPSRPEIRPTTMPVLQLRRARSCAGRSPALSADWVALKLLEGDAEMPSWPASACRPKRWPQVHASSPARRRALAIVGGRYEWVGRMVRAAVTQPPAGQITVTERLDRVAVHPVGGLVLLRRSWRPSSASRTRRRSAAGLAGRTPWWAAWPTGRRCCLARRCGCRACVADGVIGGAGTMLTFVPILAIFFAALAVLEDVGYMARAAYVMDRFMHPMGLHGNRFCRSSSALAATCRPCWARASSTSPGAPADGPADAAGALHRRMAGGGLPGPALLRPAPPPWSPGASLC